MHEWEQCSKKPSPGYERKVGKIFIVVHNQKPGFFSSYFSLSILRYFEAQNQGFPDCIGRILIYNRYINKNSKESYPKQIKLEKGG
jgi:hypothetical protein